MSKKSFKRTTKETVEAIKEDAISASDRDLTIKQENFLRFYVEIGNATEAYRRAYDAGGMSDEAIRVEANRLLKHPNISLRLETYAKQMSKETALSLEEHMSELKTLREMAKVTSQLGAAIKAEELRGKLRRFYVEQVETGGPNDFDQMTDDELREYVLEESKAALRALSTRSNGSTRH